MYSVRLVKHLLALTAPGSSTLFVSRARSCSRHQPKGAAVNSRSHSADLGDSARSRPKRNRSSYQGIILR